MAVDCTNVTLVRDTVDTLVPDAATSTVIDEVEVMTIVPTKGMDKIIIEVTVANTHGTVACSLGAGAQYWSTGAKTFNAVQNVTSVFHISDIARFLKHVAPVAGVSQPDEILLTLTPNSGKRLLTDHAVTVQVIELP